MASGTGTPASAPSGTTLATLRARIRDQVENAWGVPDPLPIQTSSETLATIRARVALHLQDSAQANWSTTDLDEAIEKALEEYNRHSPVLKIGTHTVTTAGREQDISAITGILRVVRVWCPYDSTDPDWPPNWVQFDVLPGSILNINEPTEPQVADVIRIWYTTPALLSDLNGAASTTIPEDDITYLINGAVHYAARAKALSQLGLDASGPPAPLLGTASAEILTTLRDRLETMLQDSTNATWATGDIDEAIEKAIEEYTATCPQVLISDFTVATAGRDQDISAITGLLEVKAVWFPYTAATLEYPPSFVGWSLYPGNILHVDSGTAPAISDHIRIWYTKAHTLSGLNAAAATTIPQEHITYIINGAAAYCALERHTEIAEDVTVDQTTIQRIEEWGKIQRDTFLQALETLKPADTATKIDSSAARALNEWAGEHGKAFRYGIRKAEPAWQRYAYGFRNDDIDEALRWALGRFNEIAPQETIGTLTISSAGREQSLASLTDLLRVTRVWYPYDSNAPSSARPDWVAFEQWGSTLFIKSASEPAATDVIRVWYERLCTLSGLDGASTTTFPPGAETLIVTGAVGYVTEERIMEEPATRWRIPRALKEWGLARLKDFETALAAYAQRQAAQHAGITELPPLDRWDPGSDTKW